MEDGIMVTKVLQAFCQYLSCQKDLLDERELTSVKICKLFNSVTMEMNNLLMSKLIPENNHVERTLKRKLEASEIEDEFSSDNDIQQGYGKRRQISASTKSPSKAKNLVINTMPRTVEDCRSNYEILQDEHLFDQPTCIVTVESSTPEINTSEIEEDANRKSFYDDIMGTSFKREPDFNADNLSSNNPWQEVDESQQKPRTQKNRTKKNAREINNTEFEHQNGTAADGSIKCPEYYNGKQLVVENIEEYMITLKVEDAALEDGTFECKFCYKVLKTYSSLRKHLPLHSFKRPYKCSICSIAFKRKSHLKDHFTTHASDKTYTCDFCNQSFVSRIC